MSTKSFDKVEFLKACLEVSNVKPNWAKVSDALGIKAGAASMRYSRMLKNGNMISNPENLEYLKVCLNISDAKLDFKKVGEKLGINTGAASMRYKRLMDAGKSVAPKNGGASNEVAGSSAKPKRGRATNKITPNKRKREDPESEGEDGTSKDLGGKGKKKAGGSDVVIKKAKTKGDSFSGNDCEEKPAKCAVDSKDEEDSADGGEYVGKVKRVRDGAEYGDSDVELEDDDEYEY